MVVNALCAIPFLLCIFPGDIFEPNARSRFGFQPDEDVKVNPKFSVRAASMLDMIDMAVGFLGPDVDPLSEGLQELGNRHIAYGVESEYLPVMERAVMVSPEEVLEDKFSKEGRNAWQVIFHFMITNMVKGMKQKK